MAPSRATCFRPATAHNQGVIARGYHSLLVLSVTLLPQLGSPTQPHTRARLVPVISTTPAAPGQPGVSELGAVLPLLAHSQGPHFLDDTGPRALASPSARVTAPLHRPRPTDSFQVACSARAPPAR